jgi:hypothetical protein
MGYRSEVMILIKSKEKLMESLLDDFFSQSEHREHSRVTLDKAKKEAEVKISRFHLLLHMYSIKWYEDPLVDLMDDLVKWCKKNKNSVGTFSRIGEGYHEYNAEEECDEFTDDTHIEIWGVPKDSIILDLWA